VPPDIFARYHRMVGDHVLMVSGSDMHGTPITVAADKLGMSARELAKRIISGLPRAFDDWAQLRPLYDNADPDSLPDTQDFFLRLLDKGYLFQDTQPAMYDPEAKRFLPDRYVEGTCPHCGFTDARGISVTAAAARSIRPTSSTPLQTFRCDSRDAGYHPFFPRSAEVPGAPANVGRCGVRDTGVRLSWIRPGLAE
jgi:methionyl-tRNA synthetase